MYIKYIHKMYTKIYVKKQIINKIKLFSNLLE